MMPGEDPAVLSWRIALAPRPRYRAGRHWWRELVTHTYRDWRASWEAGRESDAPAWGAAGAANSGVACHQLSDEEYEALFPRPQFRDVLVGLSGGGIAPS